MSNTNVEKSGYTGFERFLFFLTPILFTAVLLGVLLLLFNSDWRQSALEIGRKIPLIGPVLPDPKADAADPAAKVEELSVSSARQKIEELNAQLASAQTELQQQKTNAEQLQKTIDAQKQQIDDLNKQLQDKSITTQQYDAQIQSLANMYAKMTPSKAGPILESMTEDEAALVLGAMSDVQRGQILEKMTPKTAADITLKMKDASTVQDQEIAALQARVKELEQQASAGSTSLDIAELKTTFSSMQPKNAATLLMGIAASNQAKALRILSALDDTSRSQVLSAMTDLSDDGSKMAATLVGKLMAAQ